MLVSLAIVRCLYVYLNDHTEAAETLLREIGLTHEQLAQAHGQVSLATMVQAGRAAYRVTNDPALGLHFGSSIPPHALSVLGPLFIQCTTMRVALQEIQRYLPLLFSEGSFSLHEAQGIARLSLALPVMVEAEVRFAAEHILAALVHESYKFVGKRIKPIEVRFPYAAPVYALEYEEVFECPIRFGAERAEIVFQAALLDRRQPFADENTCRLLKDQADFLLIRGVKSAPTQQRVRSLLRENVSLSSLDAKEVAERLGLSARGLRRRLRSEGKTLWAVIEETRKDRAHYLLTATDVHIKEISHQLGFSEPSAFHRAFRRWTGLTPLDYKRGHQAQHTRAS